MQVEDGAGYTGMGIGDWERGKIRAEVQRMTAITLR